MSVLAKSKIVKTPAGDFTLSFYDGATPITLYLPHEFDGDYRVSCPSQTFADGQECTVEIINPLPGVAPMMAVPFSQNANPGLSYQDFIEAVKPNPTNPTNPTTNTNKPKKQTAMYLVLVFVLLVIVALVIWYFKFRK